MPRRRRGPTTDPAPLPDVVFNPPIPPPTVPTAEEFYGPPVNSNWSTVGVPWYETQHPVTQPQTGRYLQRYVGLVFDKALKRVLLGRYGGTTEGQIRSGIEMTVVEPTLPMTGGVVRTMDRIASLMTNWETLEKRPVWPASGGLDTPEELGNQQSEGARLVRSWTDAARWGERRWVHVLTLVNRATLGNTDTAWHKMRVHILAASVEGDAEALEWKPSTLDTPTERYGWVEITDLYHMWNQSAHCPRWLPWAAALAADQYVAMCGPQLIATRMESAITSLQWMRASQIEGAAAVVWPQGHPSAQPPTPAQNQYQGLRVGYEDYFRGYEARNEIIGMDHGRINYIAPGAPMPPIGTPYVVLPSDHPLLRDAPQADETSIDNEPDYNEP
jgi:hypothetical protein